VNGGRRALAALRYQVLIEPLAEEDGSGFVASVPDLPGCMSDGASPEEALARVQDAIAAWIEAARELGHPVPSPTGTCSIGALLAAAPTFDDARDGTQVRDVPF